MSSWKVRRYKDGVWDDVPPQLVSAESPQAAAEHICGCPLVVGPGPHGNYMAAVWDPYDIAAVSYFYPVRERKLRIVVDADGVRWRAPNVC